MRRRALLSLPIRIIPFIKSDGTKYIDTGFKPNGDTRVIMECDFLELSPLPSEGGEGNSCFFGSRTEAQLDSYHFFFQTTNMVFLWDYGSSGNRTTIEDSSPLRKLYIDYNKNILSFNDEVYETEYKEFQTEYNLTLLASNQKDVTHWGASVALYFCKIYDNGTLIRDFIPCINNNQNGLYDKLNNKFYPLLDRE